MDHLWYAAYGSNLSRERFGHYLGGGRPVGASRHYSGARDGSEPRDVRPLALAGQVTAASIVVAAKGLLRFPELSSRRDQARIHLLTEYFLVGSFMSWLVALTALVLLHT